MFNNFGDMLVNAGRALNAIAEAGEDNIVIVRNAGLEAKGPYEGNEDLTLDEFVEAYGAKAGIPAGVRPTYTREGQGTVLGTTQIQPGTYEAFIDKKENA